MDWWPSGATCLAYETVENGRWPAPAACSMSEIAGRLAPQIGAYFLERMSGGKGKLMGGATGVKPANVVIWELVSPAQMPPSSRQAWEHGQSARHRSGGVGLGPPGRCRAVETLHSDQLTNREEVAAADVVIGAVLMSGARTPVLVSESVVRSMQPGSVIVDLSIDQGARWPPRGPPLTACRRSSRTASSIPASTTWRGWSHSPPRSRLTNATLPYIIALADSGVVAAARSEPALGAWRERGWRARSPSKEVAEATGQPVLPLEYVLLSIHVAEGTVAVNVSPVQDPALSAHLAALRLEDGLSERTVESYFRDLTQFAAFLQEQQRSLPEATAEDVRTYLAGGRWRPSTRARKAAALRSFYRRRIELGLAGRIPQERWPARVWSRPYPRTLSIEEVSGFWPGPKRPLEASVTGPCSRLCTALGYGASEPSGCGCRTSDLEIGFVPDCGKGDKERIVPAGPHGDGGYPGLQRARKAVSGRTGDTQEAQSCS